MKKLKSKKIVGNNIMEKETQFLEKSLNLGLPIDFSQKVYSILLNTVASPDYFYSEFKGIYSENTVSEYLNKMVKNNLLSDGEPIVPFLSLEVEYDPRFNIVYVR